MTQGKGEASRFQKRLGGALRPDGWRRSGEAPVVTMPSAGTFVRPLANGWAAVLTVHWYGRDEIELSSWLPGTHGVVTVETWATFPAAERFGARLELVDPSYGFEVAPSFVVPGQEPGYRQFRGPEDDERVVTEIADYAQRVLVPAAERNAWINAWMAAYEEPALIAVAATRAALVAASRVEADLETDEPDEETSGWEVLGGLVFVVAVVVFLVGKGLQTFDIDVGWGWLPAAAMVAYGVVKIGEHSEELRERWRNNLGSADRVHEYLERQRDERERRAASSDATQQLDEQGTEPDDETSTGPDRTRD